MRRKGEETDKRRNRSHPFQVEIQIPAGGIGNAFDIMYRWAVRYSLRMTNGARSMCWCFCQRDVADAFACDFGGMRIDRPVDARWLAVDDPDARELQRRARAATFGLERLSSAR